MIKVPAGTVLRLRRGEWRYGDRPLVFQVERAREDLTPYEDSEVWLEGYELATSGRAVGWWQILVTEAVLERRLPAGGR